MARQQRVTSVQFQVLANLEKTPYAEHNRAVFAALKRRGLIRETGGPAQPAGHHFVRTNEGDQLLQERRMVVTQQIDRPHGPATLPY